MTPSAMLPSTAQPVGMTIVRMPSRSSSFAPPGVKGVPAVCSFLKYPSANLASTASPAQTISQPPSAADAVLRSPPNSPEIIPRSVTPPSLKGIPLPNCRLTSPAMQPKKPITEKINAILLSTFPSRESF